MVAFPLHYTLFQNINHVEIKNNIFIYTLYLQINLIWMIKSDILKPVCGRTYTNIYVLIKCRHF